MLLYMCIGQIISIGAERCSSPIDGYIIMHTALVPSRQVSTPLCRLCGRLEDLIGEPTRAVGATVTEGTVILIDLPRMAR